MNIVIATRESPLALWQANFVRQQLMELYTNINVTLLAMTTKGDQLLYSPLSKIGGKGLFVKELEQAILDGHADIAVHSMKDVPMEHTLPSGLSVPVILKRDDPRDVFIANNYLTITDLPEGARVGTCSLRRQIYLKAQRPDLQLVDLRGNVNTRLRKLDDGEYDAIILAAAGLKRLGYINRITMPLDQSDFLPAVGQGAIGIECRSDDAELKKIISALNDLETNICVNAERAFNQYLNGGCQAPIAAYAQYTAHGLCLSGLVGDHETGEIIRYQATDHFENGLQLGQHVAQTLLARGADSMLAKLSLV